MRILLVNDDGYNSPGILALARELGDEHEVYLCAPLTQQSGKSSSAHFWDYRFTVKSITVEKVKKAWAVEGTPADCTHFALFELMEQKPDLVISGINQGQNVGQDCIYSGTIGAAREALLAGIPAMAVSLYSFTSHDFAFAAKTAHDLIPVYMHDPRRKEYVFSINVPAIPENEIKGIRPAGLALLRSTDKDYTLENQSGDTCTYYLRSSVPAAGDEDPDSDNQIVQAGYISITPVSLNMACEDILEEMKGKKWTL